MCTSCPTGKLLLTASNPIQGTCILPEACMPPNKISMNSKKCYNDGLCPTNDCPVCTDNLCLECTDVAKCTKCINPDHFIDVKEGKCTATCKLRKLMGKMECYDAIGACPDGYIENDDKSFCQACDTSCDRAKKCKVAGSPNSCLGCNAGFLLRRSKTSEEGTCIKDNTCVSPYFLGQKGICYTGIFQ